MGRKSYGHGAGEASQKYKSYLQKPETTFILYKNYLQKLKTIFILYKSYLQKLKTTFILLGRHKASPANAF